MNMSKTLCFKEFTVCGRRSSSPLMGGGGRQRFSISAQGLLIPPRRDWLCNRPFTSIVRTESTRPVAIFVAVAGRSDGFG